MREKAPPATFVHLCPSSVPENPSLMKTSGQQRVTRVYPSVAHPPPSISLSLHLFSPSITLSAQSVLLLSRQWLYSAQLKSNHHYPFLSLQPSIPFCPPICPSPIFRSFSISSFLCPFFFFLSCARSSSRVPAATPAALPPLLCAKLWVFF